MPKSGPIKPVRIRNMNYNQTRSKQRLKTP